jgi:hypothetical protein
MTGGLVLILMGWGASPPATGQPPLPELARVAERGRLDSVTIEYWVGGGLPPPLYRSDQFRLLTVDNADILEFARPYRDPADKREGLVEKFQLAAQRADVRKLARLILDVGVFSRQFPEEKDPGRADAIATEVIVTAGGREFKRRYFTAAPAPLEPLRLEVERLLQRLVTSGKRQLFYQGQPVASPQSPPWKDTGGAEAAPEAIPLSKLASEVIRRIDWRLSTQPRLVLWLNVSEYLSDSAEAAAQAVKRALENKPGLVLATKSVAGTTPVPSEVPGGHVNMLVYAVKPHPDLVLSIGELNGRLCVSERAAGKDPLAPAAAWNWRLCAQ